MTAALQVTAATADMRAALRKGLVVVEGVAAMEMKMRRKPAATAVMQIGPHREAVVVVQANVARKQKT
jgi:hypothetical protein